MTSAHKIADVGIGLKTGCTSAGFTAAHEELLDFTTLFSDSENPRSLNPLNLIALKPEAEVQAAKPLALA